MNLKIITEPSTKKIGLKLNPVFSNRIFMKEVYAGGFTVIVSDLYILIRLKYRDHSKSLKFFGLSYK
jgi:hypothetical protein